MTPTSHTSKPSTVACTAPTIGSDPQICARSILPMPVSVDALRKKGLQLEGAELRTGSGRVPADAVRYLKPNKLPQRLSGVRQAHRQLSCNSVLAPCQKEMRRLALSCPALRLCAS